MTEYRGYTLLPVTEKNGRIVLWMVYDEDVHLVGDREELVDAIHWIDELLRDKDDGDGLG